MGESGKTTRLWYSISGRFQDEPIAPRNNAPGEKLPSLLRAARSLETGDMSYLYRNRRSIFWKQGKLLANYEDDYPEKLTVRRYYTTYESLSDRELRSYFAWRTRVRRREIQESCLSFAYLYLYELINQIGVENSLDGLKKMDAFVDAYRQFDELVECHYDNWRRSYLIYYNLSDSFWRAGESEDKSEHFGVLDSAPEQEDAAIVGAVKAIAPTWLRRSWLYRGYTADMDAVIAGVMRKMCLHYRKRGGRTLCEYLFGGRQERQFAMFESAIFCDPLRRKDGIYYLTDSHYYECENGFWTEYGCFSSHRGVKKLEELMKTIDARMRSALALGKPIRCPEQMKWVEAVLREEIAARLAEKQRAEAAAKRVAINYSALDAIRRDADVTRERLAVEDELSDEPESAPQAAPQRPPEAAQPPAADKTQTPAADCPLSAAEYRLLQCLLYGGSTAWVQQEGIILSVLLDGINEKLYDEFQDTVVDDAGIVEDYTDELKEMIKP